MKHVNIYLRFLFVTGLVCISFLSCNTEKRNFLKEYGDFVAHVEVLAVNEDFSTYSEVECSKAEFEERYNLISNERGFSSEEKSLYVKLTQRYKAAKKSLDKAYIKSEVKKTGKSLVDGVKGFLDSFEEE